MARRLLTLAVLAAVATAGCSWGGEEPGLFETPTATLAPAPTPPVESLAPTPTNPALPVAGEAVWTSGDGTAVTVRFAVHAVRRAEDVTVLDWSVTPLAERGRQPGEPLPSGVDLGLGRALAVEQNLTLIDLAGRRAYRPLASTAAGQLHRCLCTPLFAVMPTLRFGETRLLQLAFPVLPKALRVVDVALPNVAVLTGVPVTALGSVPTPRRPTDLARPAAALQPATAPKTYVQPDPPHSRETVRVDRVVVAPGLTSVEWTVHSVDEQAGVGTTLNGPPTAGRVPAGVRVVNRAPADGLRLRVSGTSGPWVGVLWTTAAFAGLPGYECVCSDLDLWAHGLRSAGGSAHVASALPGLPPGTTRVDVALPGLPVFADVPVSPARDAAGRHGPDRPLNAARWYYAEADPPTGASSGEWPTPLPAPNQVDGYSSRAERLLDRLP
jgi:hypothetical protein